MPRGLAIPGDWDGETWECIRLQIPVSPAWFHIIRGLLSSLMSGRAWDGDTGTITDAQLIARELFNRSFPFQPCCTNSGEGDESGGEQSRDYSIGFLCGEFGENGGCEMGCAPCLRWENGVLQMYSCGEWVPVPSVGNGTTGTTGPEGEDYSDPEVPLPGDDENVGDDIQCKKAFAFANALMRVHDENLDAFADLVPPWNMPGRVASRLPEYTLDKAQVSFSIAALALIVAAGQSLSIVVDDRDLRIRDIAAYIKRFMRDSYSVNASEFETVAVAFLGYGLEVEADIDIEGFLVGDYWGHLWRALGKGTANEIAIAARSMSPDDYDCEVPEIETEWQVPEDAEWAIVYDFRNSQHGFYQGSNQSIWEFGKGWRGFGYYYEGNVISAVLDTGVNNTKQGVILGTRLETRVSSIDSTPPGVFTPETYDGYTHNVLSGQTYRRGDIANLIGVGLNIDQDDTVTPYSPGSYSFVHSFVIGAKFTNSTYIYVERYIIWGTGEPPFGG